MTNTNNRDWDKNKVINNLLFLDRWVDRINESNSKNIFIILCEPQLEELDKITTNNIISI